MNKKQKERFMEDIKNKQVAFENSKWLMTWNYKNEPFFAVLADAMIISMLKKMNNVFVHNQVKALACA